MALVGIAVVVGAAFFFLAPAFCWFTVGSPSIGGPPLFTAYRSLGCTYLGVGVAYYTTQGPVFSCALSEAPFPPSVMEPSL